MTTEQLAELLRQALVALGVLFVIVDVRIGWQLVSWLRRRRTGIVVWLGPKPPYFAVNLAIGVLLGILLLVNSWIAGRLRTSEIGVFAALSMRGPEFFGLGMMFIYYGYLLPFSARIQRGIYDTGIWTNSGFMRYTDMGGLTWKAGASTLVIASSRRSVAWRLDVPGPHLGEVRHLLRDKIASHAIAFDEGPGIHLGTRDTRESV
jgi:hypothetical protein